jgi:hypothetical protein
VVAILLLSLLGQAIDAAAVPSTDASDADAASTARAAASEALKRAEALQVVRGAGQSLHEC